MSDEDKRVAVGMSVTLSSQLMTAALAIIALGGGLLGVFVQNRDVGGSFYITVSLSFVAFVVSIFIAGKGISISRKKGFDGQWSLEDGKWYFNAQAVACAVGLILFLVAVLLSGKPKDSETSSQIAALQRTAGAFEQKLQWLAKANEKLQKDLDELSVKLGKLIAKSDQIPTKRKAEKPVERKS